MTECQRCGRVHPRCKGHNKAGNPCGQMPAKHQEVCRNHGGASPQARAHAQRRALEEQAAAELEKRWQQRREEPIRDPLEELARVAGEVVAFKDLLRAHVTRLEEVLTYWTETTFNDGEELRTAATEQVRAVVAAYERAQDRAARILATIVKLDLAGRMLELRTSQAEVIVTAVREGLATVDMAAEVRTAAQAAIADRLASITAPEPPKELVS